MSVRRASRRKRIVAVAFVVLFLGGILVPLVSTTHVNDLIGLPSSDDVPDEARDGPLGPAIEQAGLLLDPVSGDINELLVPATSEPEIPATIFHESFDPNTRIGGIGEWGQLGPGAFGWEDSISAGRTGQVGQRFWDPSDGFYPILVNQGTVPLDGYLVSPRLGLQSLPFHAQAERREVSGDAQPAVDPDAFDETLGIAGDHDIRPNQIILEFWHRYHFADARDGARVMVFTEPPTDATLATHGTTLDPLGDDLADVEALENPGFTGLQEEYHLSQFRLTPWAGQDVWIVLHASSLGIAVPKAEYFSSELFGESNFFGWMIDDVRVEGPAHEHNLRVDEIAYPNICASATHCFSAPGEGEQPWRILVINQGQRTEDVEASVTVTGRPPCSGTPELPSLRPGQVTPVNFLCSFTLAEGEDVAATFQANPVDETDDFPRDNQATLDVSVRRGLDVRFPGPPTVTPRLGSSDDIRTVVLHAQNHGIATETVTQSLAVDFRLPGTDWVDVTNDAAKVSPPPDGWTSTFVLPPRPNDNQRTTQLEVLLKEAGEYRLRSMLHVDGQEVDQTEVQAGTLVAQTAAYKTTFDTLPEITDAVRGPAGSDWREWTPSSLIDQPPPPRPECESGDDCYFWEYGRVSEGTPGMVNSLVGRVDSDPLSPDEFVRLEIEVLHHMQHRCNNRFFGPLGPCAQTLGSNGSPWAPGSSPRPSAQLALAYGDAIGQQDEFAGHMTRDEFILQEFHNTGITTVSPEGGGSHGSNRHTFYEAQWLRETWVVTPEEINSDLSTIPAPIWSSLSLIFRLSTSGGFGACPGNFGYPADLCFLWRVGAVHVKGVTASGDAITLLSMNGVSGDEIGTWSTPPGHRADPRDFPSLSTGGAGHNHWKQRLVSDLVVPAPLFQTVPEPVGAWTTTDPTTGRYQVLTHEMLYSPVLEVPRGAGEPLVRFGWTRGGAVQPTAAHHGDGVSLFVRFMEEEQGGVSPSSPWFLVPVGYPMGESRVPMPVAAHRFPYATTQSLPLDSFYYLDYRNVYPDRDGGGFDGALLNPDPLALKGPFDLRDCGGGFSCVLQFGFRFEAPVGVFTPSGERTGGWWLHDFEIATESRSDHDIRVVNVALNAEYDWPTLHLGPGTEAVLDVDVRNVGIFRQDRLRAEFEMQHVDTGETIVFEATSPEEFSLERDETRTLSIPVDVPVETGDYRTRVTIYLDGQLSDALPLVDRNPLDNCATLSRFSFGLDVCHWELTNTIRVEPTNNLELTMDITPRAGRSDFPRFFHVDIHNQGNIPVDGWTLTRTIKHLETGSTDVETWTLLSSPGPGESSPWQSLNMTPDVRVVRALGDPGRYLVSFVLSQGTKFATTQMLIEGFENFYTDTFEPLGTEFSPLSTGSLTPSDDAWSRTAGTSFGSGNFAWHFGDLVRGTYPANNDSVLNFPRMDLTSASRAFLSFAHNYSLEPGYDAARLEFSLDEGDTWKPLESSAGWPGVVGAASAFNPTNDPTVEVEAYTGSSLSHSPATDGWMIEEIDLGKIPELVTSIDINRLHQVGFLNSVRRLDPPNAQITFSETWRVPGGHCLDECWYRENLNYDEGVPEAWGLQDLVAPDGSATRAWLYGTLGSDGRFQYPAGGEERLVTPFISLRGLAGNTASLTYREHFDIEPGDVGQVLVQRLVFTPEGEVPGPWTPLRFVGGTSGSCPQSWCSRTISLSPYIGEDIRLAFQFNGDGSASGGGGALGRHWAVDGITVQGDSFVGQPLHFRFRAVTDGSISEGGWSIDAIQFVGTEYRRNLAIVPTHWPTTFDVAPGDVLNLTGFVRNLGRGGAERGLHLVVDIDPIEDPTFTPPPADISFNEVTSRLPVHETLANTLGPFTLIGAGSVNTKGDLLDRVPFNISVQLPGIDDLPAGKYHIQLRLLQETAVGLAPLVDDRVGDHERTNIIEATPIQNLEIVDISLDPPTVGLGEPAKLRLTVRNTGTMSVGGSVRVNFTNTETGRLEVRDLEERAVGADATSIFETTFVPVEPGIHRVDLVLTEHLLAGPNPNPVTVGHVLAGRLPIYFAEGFEAGPAAFTAGWTVNGGCDPLDYQLNCWRLATPDAYSGVYSVQLGPTAEDAREGQTYPPNLDRSLFSPPVDLSQLASLNEVPGSRFDPLLAFRYRATLGSGDGVIVQARRADADVNYYQIDSTPGKGYNGNLGFGNPLRFSALPFGFSRPAIVGAEERWEAAEFPLGGAILETGRGQFQPLLGERAQFAYRFGSDAAQQSSGFAIDGITISSYNVRVEPSRQDIDLFGGSDKRFYFKITNTGAAADTYHLRLDNARSQFPPFFQVKVLTPSITLPAGATGLAAVQVTVPDAQGLPASHNNVILVEVASGVDPNRLATAELRVERFQPTLLPDLAIDIEPGDETGPIVEGDQLNFLVGVRNIGSRPAKPADVVTFACPKTSGNQADDLAACQESEAHLLDVRTLTTLPSISDVGFEKRSATETSFPVSWIPELGDRGDYHIVAIVDPEEIVRQFDRLNDVAVMPMTVLAIERPDLRVIPGSLRVLDSEGRPAHNVFIGETLRIEGQIENRGNADAHDAFVRLINQFPLVEQSYAVIFPGQVVTVATTWIAQPGNWVVLLEASTTTPETDLKNNIEKWSLTVRQGTLELAFEPPVLHVQPGESDVARLLVTNGRGTEVDAGLTYRADQGVLVEPLPEAIRLARGVEDAVPVMVSAPPGASRGQATIEVGVTPGAGLPIDAVAELRVFIGHERSMQVIAGSLAVPPGLSTAEIRIANHGSAADSASIAIDAPTGWSAEPDTPIAVVDAAAEKVVTVRVFVPTGTPPALYNLNVRESGQVVSRLDVLVLSAPTWASTVRSIQETPTGTTLWLLVENYGNAAGIPDLVDLALNGTDVLTTEPLPAVMEPGQSQLFAVHLAAPPNGKRSVSLDLPGMGAPVSLATSVQKQEIQLVGLELLPSTGILEGDHVDVHLHVLNAGTAAVGDAAVHLYIDGKLVDVKRALLPSGEVIPVETKWKATHGDHIVSVGVGQEGDFVARAAILQVAPPAAGSPGPDMILVVVAAMLALAVVRRRRPDEA